MKKEQELRSDNCADLLQSLNSAMRVLDWKEINNPTKLEVLRLLESLKIVIRAKLE
jgi:hypothetical protein